MTLPPPELTDAQLFALARGREIRHGMRGPMQNAQLAARVFRDAIAAIERNGSSTEYFRDIAEQEPVAFLKLLGHMLGKYLPHDSNTTDLEAEQHVYRSPEELRQALQERGIGPEMLRLMADRWQATPDANASHPPRSNGSNR
jgi:hypothetical protein